MFKNLKRKVMLTALAALALGNTLSTAAASDIGVNYAEYKGYVKKTEDLVTEPLHKTTLADGTNRPVFVQDGAALCSWINSFVGLRITDKAKYNGDTLGPFFMEYEAVVDIENPGAPSSTTMTVSTQIQEFRTTYTDGYWSPDTF